MKWIIAPSGALSPTVRGVRAWVRPTGEWWALNKAKIIHSDMAATYELGKKAAEAYLNGDQNAQNR